MLIERNWSEIYRPKTVQDVILPEKIKKTFLGFVDKQFIPNVILSGPPGTGKTSLALATIDDIGAEKFVINGSLQNGVDTIRYDITNFASSVSLFSEGRKYVVINEADWLTSNAQAGLRAFTEEFSTNCGFIFTINYKNKVFKEMMSRFSFVDFNIRKEDMPEMAAQFYKKIINILEEENVSFDKKVLRQFIVNKFPDFRKILVELQAYSNKEGVIDVGILSMRNTSIVSLFKILKNKSFEDMRAWVSENVLMEDISDIYRLIYDNSNNYIEKQSIPTLVLLTSKYMFQDISVRDQEINLVAYLTEIMLDCEFI